jgi:hypothetical protein
VWLEVLMGEILRDIRARQEFVDTIEAGAEPLFAILHAADSAASRPGCLSAAIININWII